MSKSKNSECVKVVVRCRPLNEKEIAANHERIVDMDVKAGQIRIKKSGSRGDDHRDFTFDSVYDWNSVQRDLYDETFCPLVEAVLNGFNGTIFAYGQTGTGKTFTMEGVRSDADLKGVIPRSFDHIFDHISQSIDQQYLVRASYLEIYQEEIRDLLSKDQTKRLELKTRPDTGVYVKDLLSFVTKSVKEIEHVMNVGNQNRSVGATNMNEHSSRSHAIFMITIECSEMGQDDKNHIRVGKLNLVDLAGSERQSKTGSTGDRLKEATKINLSLSALGNVISALVDGRGHIPYRDSKLTRLLQDSLGGNAKTVMVANIGPASYNHDESVTTLRYANRAKNIQNKPKINEDPKDALLREFQDEIKRLKEQLGGGGEGHGKRRRRRKNENGEMVSEDESEEEVDEENLSEEQQEQLEQEKAKILANQELEEEEKNKLLALKQEKIEEIKRAQTEKENLNAKISEMQSKLLVGGKTIIDHTKDQERQLATKRREIAEQRKKEREMQQRLESKEESALEAQESYTSLRQEVDEKTKKLKKLFMKLQATKSEIQKMEVENADEREELEQTQMQLARELKLKLLIIENFIPPDERRKIEDRSYFDESEGRYKLKSLDKRDMMKRPQSAHASNKRPKSQYARMAAAVDFSNPRYRSENILMVELDMPARTTRDYEGPTVAPKVQAALDAALQEESDLNVDADANLFANLTKKKSKNRSKSARVNVPKKQTKSEELYPTSRGLVPK